MVSPFGALAKALAWTWWLPRNPGLLDIPCVSWKEGKTVRNNTKCLGISLGGIVCGGSGVHNNMQVEMKEKQKKWEPTRPRHSFLENFTSLLILPMIM